MTLKMCLFHRHLLHKRRKRVKIKDEQIKNPMRYNVWTWSMPGKLLSSKHYCVGGFYSCYTMNSADLSINVQNFYDNNTVYDDCSIAGGRLRNDYNHVSIFIRRGSSWTEI